MRELCVMAILIGLGCTLVTIPDAVDRQKALDDKSCVSAPAWRPTPKSWIPADASNDLLYNENH